MTGHDSDSSIASGATAIFPLGHKSWYQAGQPHCSALNGKDESAIKSKQKQGKRRRVGGIVGKTRCWITRPVGVSGLKPGQTRKEMIPAPFPHLWWKPLLRRQLYQVSLLQNDQRLCLDVEAGGEDDDMMG